MNYYLPELDYYFSSYYRYNADLTTNPLRTPMVLLDVPSVYIEPKSLFSLLFNNGFAEDSYITTFVEQSLTSFPKKVIQRLLVKISRPICYITNDGPGCKDLFQFTSDDVTLFDKLLGYRTDGTCSLDDVDFEVLDSRLSKLVYLYLDICGLNNVASVDSISTIEDTTNGNELIDSLFEVYTINEVHKVLKSTEVLLGTDRVDLYNNRKVYKIDEKLEYESRIIVQEPVPYGVDVFYVYYNGRQMDSVEFDLQIADDDPPYATLTFTTKVMSVGDVVCCDYYSATLTSPEDVEITTTTVDSNLKIHVYGEIGAIEA